MNLTPQDARTHIQRQHLVAVIRSPTATDALDVIDVLVAAGITTIEITLTIPDATAVIRDVKDRCGHGVLVGAGTVTTPQQAHDVLDAGAEFIVSPGCLPALAEELREAPVLYIPGVFSPSEAMTAQSLQIKMVKLFPAMTGGPAHLRSLTAPFPDLEFMSTGGITLDNIADWASAGAVAVGIGTDLAPTHITPHTRRHVERRARQYLDTAAQMWSATPSKP